MPILKEAGSFGGHNGEDIGAVITSQGDPYGVMASLVDLVFIEAGFPTMPPADVMTSREQTTQMLEGIDAVLDGKNKLPPVTPSS